MDSAAGKRFSLAEACTARLRGCFLTETSFERDRKLQKMEENRPKWRLLRDGALNAAVLSSMLLSAGPKAARA
jgi:hypothetical protein